MTALHTAYRLGNWLFENHYAAYRPLYAAWKAWSDRRERALARQIIKPGMVVADVGANIGIYSRFFSRLVGPSGRVHAFEPAARNFSHLTETARNRGNIEAVHAAVGEHSGHARLYMSSELNVDHRMFDGGENRQGVDVPLTALDDYFAGGQRLDFIKIDVQGFEMRVLKGAVRTLTQNRSIAVLMEFWPYGLRKAGTDPREVLAFARDLGFLVNPVPQGGASPETMLSGPDGLDTYCNIVLTRPKSSS
jgi:FkbM family methyltransferase